VQTRPATSAKTAERARMTLLLYHQGCLVALRTVRRTPGISCERPIRSTLVCFIPLFDAVVPLQVPACSFDSANRTGELVPLPLNRNAELILRSGVGLEAPQNVASIRIQRVAREVGLG